MYSGSDHPRLQVVSCYWTIKKSTHTPLILASLFFQVSMGQYRKCLVTANTLQKWLKWMCFSDDHAAERIGHDRYLCWLWPSGALLYRQKKCVPTGPTVVGIVSKAWSEGVCFFHELLAGYWHFLGIKWDVMIQHAKKKKKWSYLESKESLWFKKSLVHLAEKFSFPG